MYEPLIKLIYLIDLKFSFKIQNHQRKSFNQLNQRFRLLHNHLIPILPPNPQHPTAFFNCVPGIAFPINGFF